ncbi:MAG: ATP-binding cassette domain-containing protein, partial [Candidatus Sumerlaeia bacterium]|nr:ATP-binding cassette domain-containing protein [Candidatus Sumerlaeia bacterium]
SGSARGAGRFASELAGDAAFASREFVPLLRGPLAEAVPAARFVPAPSAPEPGAAPPLRMENLQVVYPLGQLAPLRRYLPRKGYALGHAPVAGLHALRGVSLEIGPGLFGLLGPNGAGKTTLLRCIAGLQTPDRGTVRVFGAAHREAPGLLAPLIGYLPQNHGLYESMTLAEYLEYFALQTARTIQRARALHGDGGDELGRRLAGLAALDEPAARAAAIRSAAEQVNLAEHFNERLGGFSGGMKQRAGIARVLLQAPPILIVDEPTAGLDPVERVRVRLLLSQLAADRAVLFSTHIVDDLEQRCSQVAIMARGALRFSGPPAELQARLRGSVWEIMAEEREEPEALRGALLARGARVLFQVARGGREGFRVLATGAPPRDGARPVEPTLEDGLLWVLREGRAGTG